MTAPRRSHCSPHCCSKQKHVRNIGNPYSQELVCIGITTAHMVIEYRLQLVADDWSLDLVALHSLNMKAMANSGNWHGVSPLSAELKQKVAGSGASPTDQIKPPPKSRPYANGCDSSSAFGSICGEWVRAGRRRSLVRRAHLVLLTQTACARVENAQIGQNYVCQDRPLLVPKPYVEGLYSACSYLCRTAGASNRVC